MKNFKPVIFIFILALLIMGMSSSSYAQTKIRYLNSQQILKDYPAAQEIQKQLDELQTKYRDELTAKQTQLENLVKEIENQSLLLSPDKKVEKENEARRLQMEIEQYQYDKLGPQGEYYQKNIELTQPLYDKIDQVIQKISEEEEYDYVFDVVQGVILFAKPDYDITQAVLDELNKTN